MPPPEPSPVSSPAVLPHHAAGRPRATAVRAAARDGRFGPERTGRRGSIRDRPIAPPKLKVSRPGPGPARPGDGDPGRGRGPVRGPGTRASSERAGIMDGVRVPAAKASGARPRAPTRPRAGSTSRAPGRFDQSQEARLPWEFRLPEAPGRFDLAGQSQEARLP